MPDTTPHLDLPLIAPSQAQKHVTHNEAITMLDVLTHMAVSDRDLTAPPGSPSEGDRYIVASGATGDWSGMDGTVAVYADATWVFYAASEGWLCWVSDETALCVYSSGAWSVLASLP